MGAAEVERVARIWSWTTVVVTVGALVAAVVLAPRGSASPGHGLVWLLFLGSSVHVASTGWLFTQPDVRSYGHRRPARYLWAPAGLVVGTAFIAALLTPGVMAWCLLAYFAWQFFHFQKQNLGIAALCASSRGLPALRPAERRALVLAGLAGICSLTAHPQLLQLSVPVDSGVLFDAGGILFVCAVAGGLMALFRRPREDRPGGFCAVYALGLTFSFPIFCFGSPYAAVSGMTVAHGLQYLLLMGMVAAGPRRRTRKSLGVVLLCNIALVGGALLSAASHLHTGAPAERLLFGAYLGVVMAHFVVDAGLWRLRDPFPRAFMARRIPALVGPTATATHRPTGQIP